jgi:hypothetical protein
MNPSPGSVSLPLDFATLSRGERGREFAARHQSIQIFNQPSVIDPLLWSGSGAPVFFFVVPQIRGSGAPNGASTITPRRQACEACLALGVDIRNAIKPAQIA